MNLPVMLNVRGTHSQKSLDQARALHNETAGSPLGIQAARALSDMSHCVYVPAKVGDISGAKDGELLFIDFWADADGLMKFFSDKNVAEQGSKMFTKKDPTVWMPAKGAFTFHVPAMAGKRGQYVGIMRATVKSPDEAIAAFDKATTSTLNDARRRGLLSHDVYVKLGPPNEPVEVCGIDIWSNVEGLVEQYADKSAYGVFNGVFTGPPQSSVWEQATGFNEW